MCIDGVNNKIDRNEGIHENNQQRKRKEIEEFQSENSRPRDIEEMIYKRDHSTQKYVFCSPPLVFIVLLPVALGWSRRGNGGVGQKCCAGT